MSSKIRNYIVFLPSIFLSNLKETLVIESFQQDEERDIDVLFPSDSAKDLSKTVKTDDFGDISSGGDDEYLLEDFDTTNNTTDDLEMIQITNAKQFETAFQQVETNQLNLIKTKFDDLPKVFFTVGKLPNSINLSCWGCGCCIRKRPWLMPISCDKVDNEPENINDFSNSKEINIDISDLRKQQIIETSRKAHQVKMMKTQGVFCHVWCMGRYLQMPDPTLNKWQIKELIKEMFKQIENKELTQIPIGDDPHIINKYCGPSGITEDEYYSQNLKKLSMYVR